MDRVHGFTVVELMMAVAILGILTLIALPNFENQVRRSAINKVQEDLYADLVFARSESIARGRHVSICAVSDPEADLPSCSSSEDDWNKGWMVFTDSNHDGDVDAAVNYTPADEYLRLYTNSNKDQMTLSTDKTAITYSSRGMLKTTTGSTLTFCDKKASYSDALVISPGTGRVRYDVDGGASCSS